MKTEIASGDRNNNLDFIRLVAAGLVLFSHCYPLTGSKSVEPVAWLMGYESGGGLAVAVFFVISGYLITPSYLKSRSVFEYLAKRAARILPALAVAVCVTFLVMSVFSSIGVRRYFSSFEAYAYLSNMWLDIRFNLPGVFGGNAYPGTVNGSLWTLPFEAIMYMVVLVLGRFARLNFRGTLIVTVLSLIAYAAVMRYPTLGNRVLLGIAPLSLVIPLVVFFMMGALWHFLEKVLPIKPVYALVSLLVLVATFHTPIGKYLYLFLLPPIILYIARVPVPFVTGFGKRGDISYGMYIYAFPVQQVFVHVFGNAISVSDLFVRAACVTIVLSIFSWKLIEEPALARMHSWLKVRRARADAPGALASGTVDS